MCSDIAEGRGLENKSKHFAGLQPRNTPCHHPKAAWPGMHREANGKCLFFFFFLSLLPTSIPKRPQQLVYQNLTAGLKLQENRGLLPDFQKKKPKTKQQLQSVGEVSFEITPAFFFFFFIILSSQQEFRQPPVRALVFNNMYQASPGGANCFLSKCTVSPHATRALGGGRNTIHYQGVRYMWTKGIYS